MTQPRGLVTCTVRPPPRAAGQLIARPLELTFTCFPAIATRACLGTNPSWTLTSDPRAASAVRFDAANGAPHFAFQHHDDTVSGTVPADVVSVAFGGAASASAATSATTRERYRGRRTSDPEEKFVPLRQNLM